MVNVTFEPGVSAESSAAKIKRTIVPILHKAPNIVAGYDEGTGKISIAPRHIIEAHDKDTSTERETVGKEMVIGVAQMIRTELRTPSVLYQELSKAIPTILSGSDLSDFTTTWARNHVAPILRDKLGLVSKNSTYTSPYGETSSIVSEKGIPPEIAEIITIAATSHVARVIDEAVTAEVAQQDTAYEESERQSLQETTEKIATKKESVGEYETKQSELQIDAASKEAHAKPLEDTMSQILDVLRKTCGHLPDGKINDLAQRLRTEIAGLQETGLIFNRKIEYQPQRLAAVDTVIAQLMGGVGVSAEPFEAVGLQGAGNALIRLAETHVQNSPGIQRMRPQDLFTQLEDILVRNHHTYQLRPMLQSQRELLSKLEKQDPAKARKYSMDLAVRMIAIDIATRGIDTKSQSQYSLDDYTSTSTLKRNLHDLVRENPERRTILDDVDSARQARDQGKRTIEEQRRVLELLNQTAEEKKQRVSSLERMRESRRGDLKDAILVQLLAQADGKPIDHRDGIISSHYLGSQIMSDFIDAMFKGLPHFVTKNTLHPEAADFLPTLVSSMLPESNSRSSDAVHLVCDLIRRYPKYQTNVTSDGFRTGLGVADKVLYEIARGGKVARVPATVPRLSLDAIKQFGFQDPRLQAMVKQSSDGLSRFVRSLGFPKYHIVSRHNLMNPDAHPGYGSEKYSIPSERVPTLGIEKILTSLFFTDKTDGGFYIVERKQ